LAASPDAATRAALLDDQAAAHRLRGDREAELTALRAALDAGLAGQAADAARLRLQELSTAPDGRAP
jgi:hypothetical protein